jgi:hypothetical protein
MSGYYIGSKTNLLGLGSRIGSEIGEVLPVDSLSDFIFVSLKCK